MWVRKPFLELQWEMKQRQKVFHLELWLSSLLGVMALFFYQKSLWGILLFIGNGGFIFILFYIFWMYFYYRRYVLYGSIRLQPGMLCLTCGKGIHGSDDGWGFKVYGNVKPKFYQFSACETPDLCDIEYCHLSKWRQEPKTDDIPSEEEDGRQGTDAACESLEIADSVRMFEPSPPEPESDPIPLPRPYAIPNLGEKPAIQSAPDEQVWTYTFEDYPYSIVEADDGAQELYVGNSEVATSQNGIFEFYDDGKRCNVYCHDKDGKKQIEVVREGVLVFRGFPDSPGSSVKWVVGVLVMGLLLVVMVI
jgi:hypothetical protein